MEDNTTKYEFPDFGPDDDTEDMTGISIYRPEDHGEDDFPEIDFIPELPPELDLSISITQQQYHFQIHRRAS